MSAGIYHALPPEKVRHYERFIRDYERIRAEEGRGSEGDEFYTSLPYRDTTGRNSKQWKIRARSFDYLLRHVLLPSSDREHPRVLDLGAGNCWMSYRLALAGFRPVAVDLLANQHDGLGAADHYSRRLPRPFPRFRAEITRLPFRDGQFDAAIFNASFHYSEDFHTTLREALRCVRRKGLIVICDTPWYSREESGEQMVCERKAAFLRRYGIASDSIKSLDYLTDLRLQELGRSLGVHWCIYRPNYGLRWKMRPFIARLRGRREPSQFRIYVTRKSA